MYATEIMFIISLLLGGEWELKQFDVSAYCICMKCCNKEDGIAASGIHYKLGDKGVAAPRTYPFGTPMIVPGYGLAQVWDRGGAIKFKGSTTKNIKIGKQLVKDKLLTHDRIDLLHNKYRDKQLNHKDALRFGRKVLFVWVMK